MATEVVKSGESVFFSLKPKQWIVVVVGLLPLSVSAKTLASANRLAPIYPAIPQEVLEKKNSGKFIPRETSLERAWGLGSVGFMELLTGKSSALQNCSKQIVVAVIDTGIDYTHPDLKNQLWTNPGETGAWEAPAGATASLKKCHDKSCNGIDDDGNGFVDDTIGWSFVDNSPIPYDTHGHGTHIAGIVGGQNNGRGVSGICPGVAIMALKYYDASGVGYNNLTNTIKAIQYAVKMGAHIINYSGGGSDPAIAERAAIEDAQRKGVLFVAAAGNDGHSNDQAGYFPAKYALDNIIGVASLNPLHQLLPSSNYGRTVHIAAPGLSILSTLPGGKYGTMSGTSQATAFVTGAAALLASQIGAEKFDYKKIKRWVLDGAKPLPMNEGRTLVATGQVNLPRSLQIEKVDVKNASATAEVAARPSAKAAVSVQ